MSGDDVEELRAEIRRLLADALRTADATRAETQRVQRVHDDELADHDRAHHDQLTARQHTHDDELAALEAAHGVEVDQLRTALESRDLIGQAKGILMAATRCTADEAFALLVKQSQAHNRKVTEIAAELASRAPRPHRSDRPTSHPAG